MTGYTLIIELEDLHELHDLVKKEKISTSFSLQETIINAYNDAIEDDLTYIEKNIERMVAKLMLPIIEEVGYRYKVEGLISPKFIELIEILRGA